MAAIKYDFSSKASKLLHLDTMYVWNMNINLDIAVTAMHPTQSVEIFYNISTQSCALDIL